jgi:3-oxoacyl-(acyl-carrier-protein) synthase/3-hydroxymyristoyl/3-hydroxydecanoyl-(acyl carrier protein) dehydratase
MNLDRRIAIVGMAGVFPAAPDLDAYWGNVAAALDASSEPPPGRWTIPPERAFDPQPGAPDKVYSTRGYFLEPLKPDLTGLAIDPGFVAQLDPLFHLVLHTGGRAFASARMDAVDRSRVGLILGNIALPTERISQLAWEYLGPQAAVGSGVTERQARTHPLNRFVAGMPAAVLAKALGLGAGAFCLDAACASSLYALKLAADALLSGRADAMLAGGVSRPDCLYTQMGFAQLRALSRSGRCSPFDAAADGLLVGEGCGIFVLKRMADALRHGDQIHGVVTGIGLSNDVEGNLLAPASEGQFRAMRAAYRQAGWSPADVDLIECHATGTPLGDAVEFSSLCELWREATARDGMCVIGSVKSTVGHLLTGAGAAALAKVLLALRHETLPPTANFRGPSPDVSLSTSPFRILGRAEPWRRRGSVPRRAAVSGFGFGGINAQVLVEEWDAAATFYPGPWSLPTPDAYVEPIAIVGMATRFGGAQSLDAFRCKIFTDTPAVEASAGLIHELHLPLDRFRVPPKELEEMLPQQLLMLQVADEALRDVRSREVGLALKTGVIIALDLDWNTTNFHLRWAAGEHAREQFAGQPDGAQWVESWKETAHPALTANRTMGALASVAASRVARMIGAGGPSFTMSSEHAAPLQALGVMADMLRRGEIDRALVGAVDFAGDVRDRLARRALSASESGECTEGGAAVVLKRLSDAQRDGDRVYAVLRETMAGIAPASGDTWLNPFAHGRAVPSIDVNKPIDPAKDDRLEIVVAATKGRIGVADAGIATGLAAFIKACLCLHHRALPTDARGHDVPTEGLRRTRVSVAGLDGNWVRVRLDECPERALEGAQRNDESTDPAPMHSCREEAHDAASGPTIRIPVHHEPRPMVWPMEPPARTAPPDQYQEQPQERVVPTAPQPLLPVVIESHSEVVRAHEAFLRFATTNQRQAAILLERQTRLLEAYVRAEDQPRPPAALALPPDDPHLADAQPLAVTPRSLNPEQCREFAIGSIAGVLGRDYAEVDTFPTRVRLPDGPLLLVDRVLEVHGEPRSLGPGRVVTKHQVHGGRWYLDAGRIPTAIAVEAGQADLFLAGFLGIDFQTRGRAVYRLLDAVVTFHRDLPRPGEMIRYDISIDRFFRQGETHLFRFRFDGTVNGQPLVTMSDGCAGFFAEDELRAGKGIVHTELDRRPMAGKRPADWQGFVSPPRGELSAPQMDALRAGDLAAAFGPEFAPLRLQAPTRLPGGMLRLIDRVTHLNAQGGRYGLGLVRAAADIHPDDWFLTCHFVDDRVMPGTLMYECCLHTLRVFLMRLGWVGEEGEVICQPIPGIASRLKCRGQVTPVTRIVTYEVSIKELGYRPEPYAIADALMYADGKPIVEMSDMSLRMSGLTLERLREIWGGSSKDPTPPLFDRDRILAFAVGNPSDAFGEPYRVFDRERVIARLPGPPYQFLDRITEIRAEPWKMIAGGEITAEYDVPPDAWYFAANRVPVLPFSVLLEIALQPCGWLAAYLGSALTSQEDLSFRNLGGKAVQHEALGPDTGTLATWVKITKVAHSAGMIIQHFDFAVRRRGRDVYTGSTSFGFFSKQALANQVGIRELQLLQPGPSGGPRMPRPYPDSPPFPDAMLRMVDTISWHDSHGGPAGLGAAEGTMRVDPASWFFKAHFYQDPVWPGSLGVESFLQLLKFAARERWGSAPRGGWQAPALQRPHEWIYRGQVIPSNQKVTVQAAITEVDEAERRLVADGLLAVDGTTIYQMKGFGLQS